MKDKINNLQAICTELYEEKGATEEIIELQTAINRLRHKYNITDETERINGNFVQ